MKLFYSKTSPFARRITAAMHLLNLNDQIECIAVSPFDVPEPLINVNPLSQIPTLVMDDQNVLTGSSVILEYLNTLSGDVNLFPKSDYWSLRNGSNIAEGILDAALIVVLEHRKPGEYFSDVVVKTQREKIMRTLDYLETQSGELDTNNLNAYSLTLAVALGYLEFRLGDLAWQGSHPKLANFYNTVNQKEWMQATQPPS